MIGGCYNFISEDKIYTNFPYQLIDKVTNWKDILKKNLKFVIAVYVYNTEGRLLLVYYETMQAGTN